MEAQNIIESITAAGDRINLLHQEANQTEQQTNTLLPELFAELNSSLEELRVVEEELRQQNEELIGARHQVEEEKRRFQDLFNFAPDPYIVTDLNGIILEANLAASERMGIAIRRLVGKPISLFINPNYNNLYSHNLLFNWKSYEGRPIELMIRPRVGSQFPAEVKLRGLQDTEDKQVSLHWIIRDISERRIAEERLQQVNKELEAANDALENRVQDRTRMLNSLIDAAPIGIAFLDKDLRFVQVNKSLSRINLLPTHEHIGRKLSEIISPALAERAEPALLRALSGELVLDEELVGNLPQSPEQFRYLLYSCYPIMSAKEVVGIGVIVEDVTVRRLAEQAQGIMYEKTRRIADTLQTAMLQTVSENSFSGLSVSTLYKAASEETLVGGDFYDAYTVDTGKVALVVGDVSGKGLTAATHITEVKFALRAFLREDPTPARALARLNDFICEAQRQDDWGNTSLVVIAVALIEPSTGQVVYTSAGAEPILAVCPGAEEEDMIQEYGQRSGLVLGVAAQREYMETTFTLPPGGMILMSTDGITEARHGEQMLELSGLKKLLRASLSLDSVGKISRAILDSARDFSGGVLSDDACLLLAQRNRDVS